MLDLPDPGRLTLTMVSEIDIWRSATVLVKQYGDSADQVVAVRIAQLVRKSDSEGVEVWLRIAAAVDALAKAINNSEREPELYFRFSFPNPLTEEERQYEAERYDGRVDFGFDSERDLPTDGPLIVLKSRTTEDARIEAEKLWEERSSFDPAEPQPRGYWVFNEIGLVLFFHEVANDN